MISLEKKASRRVDHQEVDTKAGTSTISSLVRPS